MLAAAMAMQLPTTLENGSAGFAIAYVEVRSITALYLTGFGIDAGLWAVSIFVLEPACYLLWTAGMAVDFATLHLHRGYPFREQSRIGTALHLRALAYRPGGGRWQGGDGARDRGVGGAYTLGRDAEIGGYGHDTLADRIPGLSVDKRSPVSFEVAARLPTRW